MIPFFSSQNPRLSRRAWTLIAGVFVVAFIHFWIRTTPVRLANTDDLVFQDLADQGTADRFTVENALSQGRFYYTTPLFGHALVSLYEVRPPWLFSLLRATAFFAQIALAGWLLARVTGNPAWGAALGFFIAGTLHIPLTFYPLLSYPFDWLGFMALLVALHLHQSHVTRPRAWTGMLTGVFLVLACVMHEIFVLFFPLFPALGWARRNPHWLRESLAPLTAVAGYTAVYLLFARLHPTTYQGTQFSLNFGATFQVLARQMIGIVPGFELMVNRPMSPGFEPLWRTWPEIRHTLSTVPWPDLGLAVAEALTLTGLLLHCSRHVPAFICHWPWAIAFAVWLNLPVALSAKYQVFIMQRTFPYAYAFYSFFFLGVVVISLLVYCCRRPFFQERTWLCAGGLGAALVIICWSAAASNFRVLHILQKMYN